MRLAYKQLKNLEVETLSGTNLGHIHDIILDTDGQLILQYIVSASILRSKEYIINRSQVARFEKNKLIVDDTVKPVETARKEKKKIHASPKPIVMREEQ